MRFPTLLAVMPASALLAMSAPAMAQNVDAPPGYAQLNSLPVPVVPGDITDRPYRVIGTVNKGVRKATIFSKSVSEEKVYRELWEKAQKMGADAVINAQYGESHITGLSWGSREARGQAIKFLTDEEIAALEARNEPTDAAQPVLESVESEAMEEGAPEKAEAAGVDLSDPETD